MCTWWHTLPSQAGAGFKIIVSLGAWVRIQVRSCSLKPEPWPAGTTIRSKCSTSQSRVSACVGVRPFDPRVDGDAFAERGVLDRLEQRHRDRDLALSAATPSRARAGRRAGRRARATRPRRARSGSPRRARSGRARRRERDEDPRAPAGAAVGCADECRGEPERVERDRRRHGSLARSARSATTRMSTPGQLADHAREERAAEDLAARGSRRACRRRRRSSRARRRRAARSRRGRRPPPRGSARRG